MIYGTHVISRYSRSHRSRRPVVVFFSEAKKQASLNGPIRHLFHDLVLTAFPYFDLLSIPKFFLLPVSA
jgi:hypothetical protein